MPMYKPMYQIINGGSNADETFEILEAAIVEQAVKDYRKIWWKVIKLYPKHVESNKKRDDAILKAHERFKKEDAKYQAALDEMKELREYFLGNPSGINGKLTLKMINDELSEMYGRMLDAKEQEEKK